MTEENLEAKIKELEYKLETREQEVLKYLDKIEELEETVLNLETLISDENAKASKKKWKKAKDSILEIELEEKEKSIRNLKDRMGFLRKEKIQLQRNLERYTKEENNTTLIRIEEKKEPFETLVKELQDKINKQQIIIAELQEKIKNEEIEKMREIIQKLNSDITNKNMKIEELSNKNLGLGTNQELLNGNLKKGAPKSSANSLTEELQRKLNKAKLEIKDLQKKLEDYKIWKAPTTENSQDEIIRELRNKLERISTQDHAISALDKISNQITPPSSEDPHLALRIKELKNLIEDLKTQNIQLRLEISKLRKK